jgi:MtaA/CmuA family methyltransferase
VRDTSAIRRGSSTNISEWVRGLGRRAVIPVGGLLGAALTGTTVRQNMLDPVVKAESAARLHLELGTDAVFHIGDVVVEAEALGAPVYLPDDATPEIRRPILEGPGGLRALEGAGIGRSGRALVTIECIRLLAARLPGSMILGQVTGPFTIASGLIGYERILRATIRDIAFVEATLEACTRVAVEFARAQVEAGAGILWVGEPMAALISPSLFARLCAPGLAEVLAESPGSNILHICGKTSPHLALMVDTGARVLSLDSAVDLPAAARRVPRDVVVMGNVDPVSVVQQGTPETVAAAAEALLDAMEPFDGFILSTGCSVPRTSPIANVRALVEAGRSRVWSAAWAGAA